MVIETFRKVDFGYQDCRMTSLLRKIRVRERSSEEKEKLLKKGGDLTTLEEEKRVQKTLTMVFTFEALS